MEYLCLKQQFYTEDGYHLVPLRHQDMMPIKEWRNAQIQFLRQKEPLTDPMQQAYFRDVVTQLFHEQQPKQILFSLLLEDKCIGYGGLVHIDWTKREGEVSFLVDTQRHADETIYEKDFKAYLKMMKRIATEQLNFKRIYTETYEIRPHHIAVLETEGFCYESRIKERIHKNGQLLDALMHGYLCNG